MSSPTRRVRVVRPRPPLWRRLLNPRWWLVGMALLLLLVVGGVGMAYAMVDVPDPNEAAQTQTSIVYFADGRTEMDRISAVDREAVELDQVPGHMQEAILAAEDRSFYDNHGISPTGLARAVWAAVTGGPTQGGSTITQQYVKNYFLTQDQTLTRKAREIIIAVKIEQEKTKDEILRDYLNTIYYGRGAHGVQAASRAYFDKPASQLDVAESAFLASVIRGPSLYDPAEGAEARANVEQRMDYVLDGMVEQGWLSQSERATVTFPEVIAPRDRAGRSGPNGYLTQLVRNELVSKVGLTPEQVDMGGLRITTTIEQDKQEAAILAVENNRPSGGRANDIRVGLVSLRPGDGAMLAVYGGSNFREQQYSAATQAQLQGGSTFKVFTLVAALEEGISTRTAFDGNSPRYFSAFEGGGNSTGRVQNFGNNSYGWVDLRTATARSVNTPFAELNTDIGPEKTVEAAVKLGVPQDTPGLSPNPANVFGTASVRVVDMASAYATLAANGVRAEPYIIKEMSAVDDRVGTYLGSPVTQRVVGEDIAADAVDAMRQVVLRGTAQRATGVGRPVAGKTGTTDENRAVWFDGFTPDIATAVAMYLPDDAGTAVPMRGLGLGGEVTGGSFPVDIWTSYMRRAVEGSPRQDFPERAGVGDGNVARREQPREEPRQRSESTPTQPAPQTPRDTPTAEWSPTDVPGDRPADPENSEPQGDGGDAGGDQGDGSQGGDQPAGDGDQGGGQVGDQGGEQGDGGDAGGDT